MVRKQFQRFSFSVVISAFALTAGACGDKEPDSSVQPTKSVEPTESITPTQTVSDHSEPTKEAQPTDKPEPTKEEQPTKEPEPSNTVDVKYTKLDITEDMITSSEPWNNGPDVAANAFDGDTSTSFAGIL